MRLFASNDEELCMELESEKCGTSLRKYLLTVVCYDCIEHRILPDGGLYKGIKEVLILFFPFLSQLQMRANFQIPEYVVEDINRENLC